MFLSLCVVSIQGYAQEKKVPDLDPNFTAIIVTDIDISSAWYTEILGYDVVDKREVSEIGLKQSNLKRGNAHIELIELDSALLPHKVIPNHNPKTKLIGLFKIGFLVSEFDRFIDHINKNKVKLHGNIVTDKATGKRMVIIMDPDHNRIQIFEN